MKNLFCFPKVSFHQSRLAYFAGPEGGAPDKLVQAIKQKEGELQGKQPDTKANIVDEGGVQKKIGLIEAKLREFRGVDPRQTDAIQGKLDALKDKRIKQVQGIKDGNTETLKAVTADIAKELDGFEKQDGVKQIMKLVDRRDVVMDAIRIRSYAKSDWGKINDRLNLAGFSSEDVSILQKALKVNVDGKVGPETAGAIAGFFGETFAPVQDGDKTLDTEGNEYETADMKGSRDKLGDQVKLYLDNWETLFGSSSGNKGSWEAVLATARDPKKFAETVKANPNFAEQNSKVIEDTVYSLVTKKIQGYVDKWDKLFGGPDQKDPDGYNLASYEDDLKTSKDILGSADLAAMFVKQIDKNERIANENIAKAEAAAKAKAEAEQRAKTEVAAANPNDPRAAAREFMKDVGQGASAAVDAGKGAVRSAMNATADFGEAQDKLAKAGYDGIAEQVANGAKWTNEQVADAGKWSGKQWNKLASNAGFLATYVKGGVLDAGRFVTDAGQSALDSLVASSYYIVKVGNEYYDIASKEGKAAFSAVAAKAEQTLKIAEGLGLIAYDAVAEQVANGAKWTNEQMADAGKWSGKQWNKLAFNAGFLATYVKGGVLDAGRFVTDAGQSALDSLVASSDYIVKVGNEYYDIASKEGKAAVERTVANGKEFIEKAEKRADQARLERSIKNDGKPVVMRAGF